MLIGKWVRWMITSEVWKCAAVSSTLGCGTRARVTLKPEIWTTRSAHRVGEVWASWEVEHTEQQVDFNLGMAFLVLVIGRD